MNCAKRAIIMAAGIGKRLQPITLTTPKPLIEVNGVSMIDTIIDALHYNGIYEIIIVVGHLKEKFEPLKEKYKGILLIENPYYDSCNNISSLYVARHYLEDVVIIDGDQILYNKNILHPEFEKSGYCVTWKEETSEWLLTVNDGKIVSCERNGGKFGYQLFSVSFWSQEDGRKLKGHLEQEFIHNKNRDIYWDDVAIFCYPDKYELGIRKINEDDLMEIDTLEELSMIDKSYAKFIEGI